MKKIKSYKDRLDKDLYLLEKEGIVVKDNYNELLELYRVGIEEDLFTNGKVNKDTLRSWVKLGLKEDLVSRYSKLKQFKKGVRLEQLVLRYGEIEGKKRWESYRAKQSLTNTFEYKKEKYGWTEEQFESFNKSRSCTKELFIKRHGEEKGTEKWEAYIERQKYAGVKLDYFIERYGVDLGTTIYNDLGKRKSLTLEGFTTRYGKEEGKRRYYQYLDKQSERVQSSMAANSFFAKLVETLEVDSCKIYFSGLNKEFCKYDSKESRPYFYDFAIPKLRVIVEYHGDLYHANPKMFGPDDIPKFRGNKKTAAEIWEYDKTKRMLVESMGFKVLEVWYSDAIDNEGKELERIKNEIYNRRKELQD